MLIKNEGIYFSPDGDAGATAGQTETTQDVQSEATENATTTIDVAEFEKLKEAVKKYSQNFDRVNTEKVKLETELKKEREKSLSSKQIEEIQKADYEEKLKHQAIELEEKNLIFEKSKLLFEKKWNSDFLDIIAGKDVEAFSQNIEKVNDMVKKIVEEEVNKRLKSSNPIPTNGDKKNPKHTYTMDEVKKLAKERGVEWVKENMEEIEKSIKK